MSILLFTTMNYIRLIVIAKIKQRIIKTKFIFANRENIISLISIRKAKFGVKLINQLLYITIVLCWYSAVYVVYNTNPTCRPHTIFKIFRFILYIYFLYHWFIGIYDALLNNHNSRFSVYETCVAFINLQLYIQLSYIYRLKYNSFL